MGMGEGDLPMNKNLTIGLAIIVLMTLGALLGGYLSPHDLQEQLKIEYIVDDQGKGTVIAPPAPPGQRYPFGTDKYGYDLLTKLLDGAKYTLFLSFGIGFARVFIGGLIGMLLGYFRERQPEKQPADSWKALNGIPIFLITWLLLIGISINSALSPPQLSLLLAFVLTAVGIPSVLSTIKDKTIVLRERPYVIASESLGADHWTIVRSHLFPFLKESFLILIVQEIVLVLTLFGQLAIFNLFVGGTTMYMDPPEYHSRTNEWAGLIGQARGFLYTKQWILFIPLAAYVLLIMGFQLISNGLQQRYNRIYAKPPHL